MKFKFRTTTYAQPSRRLLCCTFSSFSLGFPSSEYVCYRACFASHPSNAIPLSSAVFIDFPGVCARFSAQLTTRPFPSHSFWSPSLSRTDLRAGFFPAEENGGIQGRSAQMQTQRLSLMQASLPPIVPRIFFFRDLRCFQVPKLSKTA